MISVEEQLIRTHYEKRAYDAHNLSFENFTKKWDTMNSQFYYDFLRELPLDEIGWPIVNWIDDLCADMEK